MVEERLKEKLKLKEKLVVVSVLVIAALLLCDFLVWSGTWQIIYEKGVPLSELTNSSETGIDMAEIKHIALQLQTESDTYTIGYVEDDRKFNYSLFEESLKSELIASLCEKEAVIAFAGDREIEEAVYENLRITLIEVRPSLIGDFALKKALLSLTDAPDIKVYRKIWT